MTHGETKQKILKAKNFEQANAIIEKTYCKNEGDKIDYLTNLFAIKPDHTKNKHDNYVDMITSILKKSA